MSTLVLSHSRFAIRLMSLPLSKRVTICPLATSLLLYVQSYLTRRIIEVVDGVDAS